VLDGVGDVGPRGLLEACLGIGEASAELIEAHLGWRGMASGCYYFPAHMSDIPKDRESMIAKYTPIAVEDLKEGAFDIDWFNAAYKELGKAHFECLYDAAKYISDGAKHARARKFADAVRGKRTRAGVVVEDSPSGARWHLA